MARNQNKGERDQNYFLGWRHRLQDDDCVIALRYTRCERHKTDTFTFLFCSRLCHSVVSLKGQTEAEATIRDPAMQVSTADVKIADALPLELSVEINFIRPFQKAEEQIQWSQGIKNGGATKRSRKKAPVCLCGAVGQNQHFAPLSQKQATSQQANLTEVSNHKSNQQEEGLGPCSRSSTSRRATRLMYSRFQSTLRD